MLSRNGFETHWWAFAIVGIIVLTGFVFLWWCKVTRWNQANAFNHGDSAYDTIDFRPKSAIDLNYKIGIESDISDILDSCSVATQSSSSSSRFSKHSMLNKIFGFNANEVDEERYPRNPFSDTANVVSIGGYHTKKSCSYQSFHIGDGGTTDLPTPFRRDQTDLGKVAEDSRIEAMKEMCKMPTNHYMVEDSSCSESDSTSSSEFDALD